MLSNPPQTGKDGASPYSTPSGRFLRLPGRAGGCPPSPPQTRTCAMNAYGASGARVSARLWHITVLPCTANQMLWTILGVGSTYVCSNGWHFSQLIALVRLRRLNQDHHAFSA